MENSIKISEADRIRIEKEGLAKWEEADQFHEKHGVNPVAFMLGYNAAGKAENLRNQEVVEENERLKAALRMVEKDCIECEDRQKGKPYVMSMKSTLTIIKHALTPTAKVEGVEQPKEDAKDVIEALQYAYDLVDAHKATENYYELKLFRLRTIRKVMDYFLMIREGKYDQVKEKFQTIAGGFKKAVSMRRLFVVSVP
jgi:hypothetical protein